MKKFCCLACGGDACRSWLHACPDYYLGIGDPAAYVVCDTCGLVQQWPLPGNPAALYQDYPVHTPRTRLQKWARAVLQRQVYYRPPLEIRPASVLDYGCGDGLFLSEAAARFQTRVGFEPDAAHAASVTKALGVPVYSDATRLAAEWPNAFDVVTAHYVMEHVADLHDVFGLFQRVLKPGGLLHIAVPNIRSWEARLFGRKWHGLDAPRHISFPDLATFQAMAVQYGFDPPQRRTAIFPNTLAASLSTALTGRFNSVWFHLMILPCWACAALAPSGTEVFLLKKSRPSEPLET